MKRKIDKVLIIIGALLIVMGMASFWLFPSLPSGKVVQTLFDENNNPQFEVVIRNPQWKEIRLSGGQMDWCGSSACYHVDATMPQTIPARGKFHFRVTLIPRSEKIGEMEFTLFVEGKSLDSLIPVRITLPSVVIPQKGV